MVRDDAGSAAAVPHLLRDSKPVGVVLWASVSDEVAERLAQGTTKLRPQDWKLGDKLWIVEVIALKDKVFPTRQMSFLAVTKDGKQVRMM